MQILPNLPRVLTSIAESAACFLVIYQINRKKLSKYWPLIFSVMALGQLIFQLIAEKLPLSLWIPGMFLNFFWMYLTILFTTKLPKINIFYGVCKASVLAEFVAAFTWQVYCHLLYPFFEFNKGVLFPFVAVVYTALIVVYYFLDTGKNKTKTDSFLRRKDALIIFLIAIITFTVSNIGFILSGTVFNLRTSFTIYIFRTLIDLYGIFIIYILEKQRFEVNLINDLTSIRSVLQSQYEQYEAYRESTQLVNQQIHDLKHQIDVIQMEADSNKQKKYLNQLRENLQNTNFLIKTGNPIIDIVLTRKNMYSIKNKINFTCIADGALLNFMNEMDLTSLLGNALDNAIESTMKLANIEHRLINLRISRKNQFVLILLENYVDQAIDLSEGLPQTTKKDTALHGYGLKSISYVAEKYNGNLSIKQQDHWFKLSVLIPIPTH